MGETDADNDGISDMLERALGTDPNKSDSDRDGNSDLAEIQNGYDSLGSGRSKIVDNKFSRKLSGRFLLSVENHGELWYVNTGDNKRYYISGPGKAFVLIRAFGLGAKESSIAKIPQALTADSVFPLEKSVADGVNAERSKRGLPELRWNEELAAVAREHSRNLASENKVLVNPEKRCDFPVIHHEGFDFGLYQQDRLKSRGVNYFGSSAENIALIPSYKEKKFKVNFSGLKIIQSLPDCSSLQSESAERLRKNLEALKKPSELESAAEKKAAESALKNAVKTEIEKRKGMLKNEPDVEFSDSAHLSPDVLAAETIKGWMDSAGHRANLLNEKFDEAGIGIAVAGDYLIITQVFIKRASCGYEGGSCCVETGYYPFCYKGLDCGNNICNPMP
jgi:uncharacterized protein YkwD